METAGGRMFVNLSLEVSAKNIANTEKPKPRRKPTLRDTERLKTFNAKKAAAAKENKDATSEESSEVENFGDANCTSATGNQRPTLTDKVKDNKNDNTTEKPVVSEVELDGKDSGNKLDNVPTTRMDTKSGEDFLCDARKSAKMMEAASAVVGTPSARTQITAGPGPGEPKQRFFTGTVTKLHDKFGFVDEDVFFQTSVVKGDMPRIHERVLVEASYSSSMPFKWNASRVQVLPNQSRASKNDKT